MIDRFVILLIQIFQFMSSPIKTTLMRFQTVRGAQLPSDENKKLLFVQLSSVSDFAILVQAVQDRAQEVSKRQAMHIFFKSTDSLVPPPFWAKPSCLMQH